MHVDSGKLALVIDFGPEARAQFIVLPENT